MGNGTAEMMRFYREAGTEIKDFEIGLGDAWGAEELLQNNWEHFSQTYLENHGRQPRED